MKILSKRQILMLHAALAARAGSLDGLRDEGLLDSAIHAPMQTFGGQELYPSTLESGPSGLWTDPQPSLCGRKQAHRHPRHAGVSGYQRRHAFL